MRIDWLKITSFKNLREFEIDFDEKALISVIVGRNGTGKSNIIEALVIIFRDLDLGADPQFGYELVYRIGEHQVKIDADPTRRKSDKRHSKDFYHIDIKNLTTDETERISIGQLSRKGGGEYLPRYVFGYYSGPSNRLETHFGAHQKTFKDTLINQSPDEDVPPLRPLLYARLIHSQFALLAFFLEDDDKVKAFLKDQLNIVGLDSVLFVLKTPEWAKDKKKRADLFWTARGTVRVFMERLYEKSLAPLRLRASPTEDFLYLYVRDRTTLQELAAAYVQDQAGRDETSFQSFFKALESTYISDLIQEVRIKVKIKGVDGSLTFRELSEGEQQLLMVLGLLRFTKEDESLFLLDEPDTHLNPAWSIKYLEFISSVVRQPESSQLILSTHNPLTLATLKRGQVVILDREDDTGTVSSDTATQSPRGMGVGGILTSDIFGLRSVLDPVTLHALDRQRELSVKAEEMQLTNEESVELAKLNEDVGDLDFRNVVRDPLYPPYVSEITKFNQEQELNKLVLSPSDRQRQRTRVREIVRRLKQESGEE